MASEDHYQVGRLDPNKGPGNMCPPILQDFYGTVTATHADIYRDTYIHAHPSIYIKA